MMVDNNLSPVIVLLKQVVTIDDLFQIKHSSKIKKCSICGSSRGHRHMKKQHCFFLQLIVGANHLCRKSLQICAACRQNLDQLSNLKEEMDQLSVTIDAMVKLIKLKMTYQAEIAKNEEEASRTTEQDENLDDLSETDAKPVIVNYEDDELDVFEEIIRKPGERPEIKRKRPGPWSKRKRSGPVNVKKTENTENEIKHAATLSFLTVENTAIKGADMSSFLKVELKKENEQNVENCTFSDNETDQEGGADMMLPEDNDDNNNGKFGKFIIEAETTPVFLSSDSSTGGDLPSSNTLDLQQTAPIIRPSPTNIIPPLPTPQRDRFIPGSEAVCPNCGTRSRDLHVCEYCKTRFSDTTKIINIIEFNKTETKKEKEGAVLNQSLDEIPAKKLKSSLPENGTESSSDGEIVKIIAENLVVHASDGSRIDNNFGESQGEEDDEIPVLSEKLDGKPPPNFSPDTKVTLECRSVSIETYQTRAAGSQGFILATICQKGIEFAMLHTQCGRPPVKCFIPMDSITQVEVHPYAVSLSLQGTPYLDELRMSLGFSSNPKHANYHYDPQNPRQKKITLISHDSMMDRMPILKFLIPSPAYTLDTGQI
ncbi:uncharacterized protein LOC110854950 isoform X2 [Folsomia candida]|uniref:uncharacterized protein LOC110854950 isoform X2 n=1 Tax=Folsomia candida TaxID=158441 RepID=UPI001604D4C8|nr:uncharacterized protein LOC110854950 isoform X2 [Folsomia candida]